MISLGSCIGPLLVVFRFLQQKASIYIYIHTHAYACMYVYIYIYIIYIFTYLFIYIIDLCIDLGFQGLCTGLNVRGVVPFRGR